MAGHLSKESAASCAGAQPCWEELTGFCSRLLARLCALQHVLEGEARPAGLAVRFEELPQALELSGVAPADGELQERFGRIRERLRAAPPADMPFAEICGALGLTPLGALALLLALCPLFDRKFESAFALLSEDRCARAPSAGVVLEAARLLGLEVDKEDLARLCALSGVYRLAFEEHPDPVRFGLATLLIPCFSVVQAARGALDLPPLLRGCCAYWLWQEPLPLLQVHAGLCGELADLVLRVIAEKECFAARGILLVGEEGAGRGFLIRHAAKRLGLNLLEVDLHRLPPCAGDGLDALLLALEREFLLRPCMICLRGCDASTLGRAPEWIYLMEGIAQFAPLFWMTADRFGSDAARRARIALEAVEVPAPDGCQTLLLLRQYAAGLRLAPGFDLEEPARRYRLLPGDVVRALELARMSAYRQRNPFLTPGNLLHGIAACHAGTLGGLGEVLEPRDGWEDLVLPDSGLQLMRLAAKHMKYRGLVGGQWGMDRKLAYGRGVCVLFYGAPGTGKSMAAQVLARDVGLELFRVDAAQLTSKYIGETAKNLSRVFDQARGGNRILFFDEADAIFGRRGEVRDSHDRYANSDTAFLLQKIEEYDGMTILATNLLNNIDDAFRRRVTYAIPFVAPDQELRARMWQTMLPEEMPHEDLDIGFLSRFELSGSGIRSVLLSAAYLAAPDERLGMRQVIPALWHYLNKSGKSPARSDLAPYDALWEPPR